jgi:hypothetical protein
VKLTIRLSLAPSSAELCGALSPFHNTSFSARKIQEFTFVNNLYFRVTYLINGSFSVTLFLRLHVLINTQNVQKVVKRPINCSSGAVLCVILAIVWFFFALGTLVRS